MKPTHIPLAQETRTCLPTTEAAFHLNRKNNTLRIWAMRETYPAGLKPVRVSGRLAWPVEGIKKLLNVI